MTQQRPATELVIIGGGAAGLMAGACAGEFGLRALIVERRHRAGLKLLMCGNNRCNLTSVLPPRELAATYGEAGGAFLYPALLKFPPETLRRWFADRHVPTSVHDDARVFPCSGKADDVLHLFRDCLRADVIPLMLNAPVSEIVPLEGGGFLVRALSVELRTPRILLTTGGVSYPKTGSTGDGQRFARSLGHRVLPYRPGLAGIELGEPWLAPDRDCSIPQATVMVYSASGQLLGQTHGEILLTKRGARGPAMVNASSLLSRANESRQFRLIVDLVPNTSEETLTQKLARENQRDSAALQSWLHRLLPAAILPLFVRNVLQLPTRDGRMTGEQISVLVKRVKNWELQPLRIRPLKEAMVTVGGVDLQDVDPQTMESRFVPGLYFAGEVLNIDGMTGGFNLQAAFATARLAVFGIAGDCGLTAEKRAHIRQKTSPSFRRPSGKNRCRAQRGRNRK